MKYLITELAQEFDETCLPLRITEDPSDYGYGYEVYEILEDGTFKLIKEWNEAKKEGFALYYWDSYEQAESGSCPTIIRDFRGMDRDDFSKEDISMIKEEAKFNEDVDFILSEISCCGEYAEESSDGKWVVFGSYRDDDFSVGW